MRSAPGTLHMRHDVTMVEEFEQGTMTSQQAILNDLHVIGIGSWYNDMQKCIIFMP